MSLLPKCPSRFDKKSFWDSAYKSSDRPFEWYADFEDLLPLFVKYFRPSDRVLNIGCGNSDLGANLFSSGWEHVTNIDISETAISKMKSQYPTQDYQQMDATNMTFEENLFDAVIDKGTIDALLPRATGTNEGEGANVVKHLLSESLRVLRPMGRFLCISLAQRHVVETLKTFFEQAAPCHAIIRAHYLPPPSNSKSSAFVLPVFVFVAFKMKTSRTTPIYELQSRPGSNFDSTLRCVDGASWATGVLAHQVVQYNIRNNNNNFPPRVHPSEHFDVILEVDGFSKSQFGGFRLFVVDKPGPAALKFAVFVVPCGREIEDLYSTVDGRNRLADAVSAGRLIVCTVIPKSKEAKETNDSVLTLSGVTALLNEVVIQFAPPSFIPGTDNAPYLTEGVGTNGNQQKLGSLFVKAESNFLRVVEVETSVQANCRNLSSAGKRKAKKKAESQAVQFKQFKQLTETDSGHLSCIAQICRNHVMSSNWNCQQLPSSCVLRQLLSGASDSRFVLQIGDDCRQLFFKVKNSSLAVKSWNIFCASDELVSEAVKNEMKLGDQDGCSVLSTSEELFAAVNSSLALSSWGESGIRFSIAICMMSCAFIRSIEVFVENVFQIIAEDGHVILVRCCREPVKDMVKLETQLRSAFSSKNRSSSIVPMDITNTIGDWSADGVESS